MSETTSARYKSERVASLLTRVTGDPLWGVDHREITSASDPRYAFHLAVQSDEPNADWMRRAMQRYEPNGLGGIVRLDRRHTNVTADAIVVTRLGRVAELMSAHYEMVVVPKLRERE